MRSKVRSLDDYQRYINKQSEPAAEAVVVEAGTDSKEAPAKNGAAATPPSVSVPGEGETVGAAGAASKKAAVTPATPNTRYVLRGGVTMPISEGTEDAAPTSPRKPEPKVVIGLDTAAQTVEIKKAVPKFDGINAAAAEKAEKAEATAAASSPASLWERLPRHIQLLAQIPAPLEEEVAQKYYTRGFRESREELIERLLDPPLTLEDTARVLGVCPATVRRYTNRGVLLHQRTVGQQRRFRLSDVLLFLEKQQIKSAKSKK